MIRMFVRSPGHAAGSRQAPYLYVLGLAGPCARFPNVDGAKALAVVVSTVAFTTYCSIRRSRIARLNLRLLLPLTNAVR